MPDATLDPPGPPRTSWHCPVAWVLLLLSVLEWHAGNSPFAVSEVQEQAGTIMVTVVAFILAVQANPTLVIAPVPSQLLAGVLAAASTVPSMLALAPLNSLVLSTRLALVVMTVWLLSPIVAANPAATLRACLWTYAVVTLCLLAGGVLAPGRAFLPGTHQLSGLLPPMHPSQVGAVAAITVGLSLLAALTGAIGRRLGTLMTVIGVTVLVESRSRTATLAALLGLLAALVSLAVQNPRARRLLGVLACVAAVAWIMAAPAMLSWFARGQTQSELAGFTGRRAVWKAMLEDRPSGLTDWLGIGLGDKRYKGRPIDGGWIAAYWQQGLLGVGVTALLVLVVAWQAIRSPPGLIRGAALFLTVFVAISANTETGISDTSIYFLLLVLAGVMAIIRPSATQRNRHADRHRSQPLSLSVPERRKRDG